MAFHPGAQLGLSRAELDPFETFLFNRTGFRFDRQRRIALDVAILNRMSALGLASSREYYNVLRFSENRQEEFQELLSLVTVSETSFFRNRPHFEALRKGVLPELIDRKRAGDRSVRIWSAGCSTGEEPYSVAVVCMEAFPALEAWKVDILATDIVKRALTSAKHALYSTHSLRQIDSGVLDVYFTKVVPDKYQLSPRIANMVRFLQSDLTREPQAGFVGADWDIIFCRNVLIYFTDEVARSVVHYFYDILNPGGYLFLGHAEMLSRTGQNDFKLREFESTFVYQKPAPAEGKPEQPPSAKASHRPRRVQAVQTLPNAPRAPSAPQLAQAEEDYSAKRYDRALEEALRLLEREPSNPDVVFLVGRIYANTGRGEEAAEKFHQVTVLSPLNAQAYYHLGIIYSEQRKPDAAIEAFKRAIYSDNEFGLAHLNLANVYREQGRYKDALRSYRNAVSALEKAPEEQLRRITDGFTKQLLVETCSRYMNECREKLGAVEYLG